MADTSTPDVASHPIDPTVETVMSRALLTTTPKAILSAAKEIMEREGVRQLPVIEDGQLVGILSERDLHAHAGYLERTKVDGAMTWSPLTLAPTDTALHAARIMIDKKMNALPVVEGDRLVGIVSKTDLLRLLVDVLERRKR